jgi:hypothetical protein
MIVILLSSTIAKPPEISKELSCPPDVLYASGVSGFMMETIGTCPGPTINDPFGATSSIQEMV